MAYKFTKEELDHVKEVEDFFKKQVPKLQRQAHISFVDLKSPQWSDMPKGEKLGNATDDKYSAYVNAQVELKRLFDALKYVNVGSRHKERDYALYLHLRWFGGMDLTAMAERFNYSNAQMSELMKLAHVRFYDVYSENFEKAK